MQKNIVINKLKKILEKSENFNDIELAISKVETTKEKGDLFELFCMAYLEIIHPIPFKSITLFEETNKDILSKINLKPRDNGIDIIAVTEDEEIWAVQAKFRSYNELSWSELSTFVGVSEKADFRLVMGNIKVIKKLKEIYQDPDKIRFSQVLRTDFQEKLDKNNLNKISNYFGENKPVISFKPRQHQQEAIDNAVNHYKSNTLGQMIHACGTGKTLTSLWIKEKFTPKNTIVFLPSLALLKQTLEEWTKHKKQKFLLKCVCSDKSVAKNAPETDENNLDLTELGVPVTTDPDKISTFLKGKDEKILFSTYQSADVVLKAIESINDFEFDFGIFDEAHRTATRANKLFAISLKLPIKKKLFMTATPKLYMPHLRKKAEEENVELCSMDDESIYGKPFHEIKFGKAIKLKLLSDYKIKVILVKNSDIKELIDRRFWLEVDSKEIKADEVAKVWALTQAMSSVNHVISFHSRVSYAKEFTSNLDKLNEWLNNNGRVTLDIKTYHISGDMPASTRSDILKEFISEDKSLVSNARCLTEGVDVPEIDGIYFVDPKRNLIDIVQATGRAIRKKKDSNIKYGHIIIPVFIENEDNINTIMESSAFDQVWKVVQAMKEQDKKLQMIISELKELEGKKRAGSIKSRERSEHTRLKKDLANYFEDNILPKNIDFDNFLDKICIKTIEKINLTWNEKYEVAKKFFDENKRLPKINEYMGEWIHSLRNSYRNKKLSKKREDLLKSITPDFFKNPPEAVFEKVYEEIKEFREKNDRLPKTGEKNYQWLRNRRIDYKHKRLDKKKIKLLKDIDLDIFGVDINEEEFMRLIKYTNQIRHKLAYFLSWKCGLRLSELLNLKREDLDFDKKNIILRKEGNNNILVSLPDEFDKKHIKHIPFGFKDRALQKSFRASVDKSNLKGKRLRLSFDSLRHNHKIHKLSEKSKLTLFETQKERLERRYEKQDIISYKSEVYVTEEEFTELLKSTRQMKHKVAYLLAWGAGLKIGEILILQAKDINLKKHEIIVNKKIKSKERIVPTPKSFKEKHLQYIPFDIKDRALQKAFRTSAEKSGLKYSKPKARFSSLRRSFAINCVKKKIPLKLIQNMLGHSDIKTTEKFSQANFTK